MARVPKPKKQISIEETLWDSANKLRGSVESSEYKHVVLGLIFLKFASDKFEERNLKVQFKKTPPSKTLIHNLQYATAVIFPNYSNTTPFVLSATA
jgi:type I restriction-modification system DNA methylase subunit